MIEQSTRTKHLETLQRKQKILKIVDGIKPINQKIRNLLKKSKFQIRKSEISQISRGKYDSRTVKKLMLSCYVFDFNIRHIYY